MNFDSSFIWLTLLTLGAFHGANPGMGWLFAVALGLQEGRRAAVWQALGPLALGHAVAVGCAVLIAALIGIVIPPRYLKWGVAALLLGLGCLLLLRHWHPRFGGMKVGRRDLAIWSFLMASAHGAGLMVIPFIVGTPALPSSDLSHTPATSAVHAPAAMHQHHHTNTTTRGIAARGSHTNHASLLLSEIPSEPVYGLLVTLVHTLGYLIIMGLVAVLIYEKFGLRLLRHAWVNVDLIWAGTLVATAVLTVTF